MTVTSARSRRPGRALPGGVGFRVIPGWRSIKLDPVTRRLTVPPGVQLDLGATVKGWAADRSAARIAEKLGCGVLVSLGGDTAVAGEPPDGGWRIRVQDVTGMPDQPPARAEHGGGDQGRRARHLVDGGAPLAARRRRAAPHPGPAHRPARGARLANGLGGRRQLRRREHGGDRGDHQGPSGAGLAGQPRPARPARRAGRHRSYRRGLARPTRSDYAASSSRSQSSAAAAVQDWLRQPSGAPVIGW